MSGFQVRHLSLNENVSPCLLKGGSVYHRDGSGHEPIHWISSAAAPDPLRPSLCRHRALRLPYRLHPAHHLPPLQGPLAHQSPERCYRGMPAGCLQVKKNILFFLKILIIIIYLFFCFMPAAEQPFFICCLPGIY